MLGFHRKNHASSLLFICLSLFIKLDDFSGVLANDIVQVYYISRICGVSINLKQSGHSSAAIFRGWQSNEAPFMIDTPCLVNIYPPPSGFQIRLVIDYIELEYPNSLNIQQAGTQVNQKFSILRSTSPESITISSSSGAYSTLTLSLPSPGVVQWSKGGFRIIATAVQQPHGADCSDGQFKCKNNFCIAKELKCDGHNNCGDYSDEADNMCSSKRLTGGAIAGIVIGTIIFLIVLVVIGFFVYKFMKTQSAKKAGYEAA